MVVRAHGCPVVYSYMVEHWWFKPEVLVFDFQPLPLPHFRLPLFCPHNICICACCIYTLGIILKKNRQVLLEKSDVAFKKIIFILYLITVSRNRVQVGKKKKKKKRRKQ